MADADRVTEEELLSHLIFEISEAGKRAEAGGMIEGRAYAMRLMDAWPRLRDTIASLTAQVAKQEAVIEPALTLLARTAPRWDEPAAKMIEALGALDPDRLEALYVEVPALRPAPTATATEKGTGEYAAAIMNLKDQRRAGVCPICKHDAHDGKCRRQVMDLSVGYDKLLQCGCRPPATEKG